jgi:hypothetical protein
MPVRPNGLVGPDVCRPENRRASGSCASFGDILVAPDGFQRPRQLNHRSRAIISAGAVFGVAVADFSSLTPRLCQLVTPKSQGSERAITLA